MKLAHLADLHLGFRRYERSTPLGQNQREADVAAAFSAAVTDVILQRPDAVVIAGDVFHSVRPPNGAILFAFSELQRLRAVLPEAPIVVIAGDHDTPRSSESQPILALFRALGILVAQTAPLMVPAADGLITAVPLVATAQLANWPSPKHVLVTHGDVLGIGGRALDPAWLRGWDYVALGHYHVAREVTPHVWYAGALEYTTSDPWAELADETRGAYPCKGYLTVTLRPGDPPLVEHRPVPTRAHIDVRPINAANMGAAAVDAAIAEHMMGVPVDGAVVRLRIENLPRRVLHDLNYRHLDDYRRRALHFQLRTTRPASEAPTVEAIAGRMRRLEDMVDDHLANRALPDDVDRAALRQLGQHYLKGGEQRE